jgi:hypothetical protein
MTMAIFAWVDAWAEKEGEVARASVQRQADWKRQGLQRDLGTI